MRDPRVPGREGRKLGASPGGPRRAPWRARLRAAAPWTVE